jgi:hypothetical protein
MALIDWPAVENDERCKLKTGRGLTSKLWADVDPLSNTATCLDAMDSCVKQLQFSPLTAIMRQRLSNQCVPVGNGKRWDL